MFRRLAVVCTVAIVALLVGPAHAQQLPVGLGAVEGIVVDSTEQPLEGIAVTLVRADGSVVADTVTTIAGRFVFAGVAAGAYEAVARIDTFAPQRVALAVETGTTAQVRISMALQTRDVVTVQASAVGWASSATRTDTPLRDLPQSVSVIPHKLLDEQATTRLTDVITNASGVIAASGVGGTSENFNVRGLAQFAPSQDGVVSRVSFGGFEDLANIERIEVLKGPASAVYGQAMPGGFVNLVTKRPEPDHAYEFGARAGAFSTYSGWADGTGRLTSSGTVSYRLVSSYENAESFRDFITNERTFVAPSVLWRLRPSSVLTASGEYRNQRTGYDLGIPAAGNEVADIPRNRNLGEDWERVLSKQWLGRLFFEHGFGLWNLRANVRYRSRDIDQFQITPALQANGRTLARSGVRATFFTPVWDSVVDVTGYVVTGPVVHRLLIGSDTNHQRGRSAQSARVTLPSVDIYASQRTPYPLAEPALGPTQPANRSLLAGVYVQDQLDLGPHVKVLVGGRFDRLRDHITNRLTIAGSPRLGVVAQPNDRVSIYGSYMTSYVPNTGVAFDGQVFEPQRGKQYEVGLKADAGERMSGTVAWFDLTRSNVPTPDPDHAGFSVIVGEQRSRGLEVEASARPASWATITGSYTRLDAEVTRDNSIPRGNQLLNAPRHAARVWATAGHRVRGGELTVGGGVAYQDRVTGDNANTFFAPSATYADAMVGYHRRAWGIAVNMKNLSDALYYRTHLGRTVAPAAPRAVTVTLTVRGR